MRTSTRSSSASSSSASATTGKRLHTGRSRNEQVALDLRLYLRRRIRVVQRATARHWLPRCRRALPTPAPRRCRRTRTCAGRSPSSRRTTGWRTPRRSAVRASASTPSTPRPTRCRWGRARSPATRYPIDVEFLRDAARLLARRRQQHGHGRPTATSSSSFLHACALVMVHVSRLAEDVIIYGSEEFGFFELDDSVDHRQQPDAAEEEPRSAGTRTRQDGTGHRPAHRLAGHDEGPADRLQQGSAGRQGGGLRHGRHRRRQPDVLRSGRPHAPGASRRDRNARRAV